MKYLFVFILLFLFSCPYMISQTLLSESFNGNIVPPTGWSIDKHATNWLISSTNKAGGIFPEGHFSYTPTWVDTSRLISPIVNTSGVTLLNFQFRHYLSHYATPYTIGVATRSGGGVWNTIWSISPVGDIPAETRNLSVSNADVGSTTFQICLYYQGDSYNINDWYFDDIVLAKAQAHDVALQSINGGVQFISGNSFTPSAQVQNFGTNVESFPVECKIYDFNNNVLTQSTSNISNLAIAENRTVNFAPYILPNANYLYKVEYTTQLAGDLNPANNTLSKYINTYTTTKKAVLVEIGTGTWCQYCPGSQLGADDLISNGKKVGVVEYHGYSLAVDPYTTNESSSRISYYGITGYPTAFFDGTLSMVGGDHTISMYPYYLPLYDSMFAVKTALDLNIYGHSTNDTAYALTIKVDKIASLLNTNTRLFVALTESHMQYVWQGQTEVNNCQRLLLPDANGYAIDMSTLTTLSIPFTMTMYSSWIKLNCNIIAFVQDLTTKEILNTQIIKLSDLKEVPVELTTFNAVQTTKGIKLSWITATEKNNRGFEIQRSFDNNKFISIGFVKGNNTTVEVSSYIFIDKIVTSEKEVHYRLRQVDYDGSSKFSDVITLSLNMPLVYNLNQNYPNPFNPSTKILYSVPENGLVIIKIYNIAGKEITTLVNEVKEPGNYAIDYNAAKLSSGVYFYKMISKKFVDIKKMCVIK